MSTELIGWRDITAGWKWLLQLTGTAEPVGWATAAFNDTTWLNSGGVAAGGGWTVGHVGWSIQGNLSGQPFGNIDSAQWNDSTAGIPVNNWPQPTLYDLYVRKPVTLGSGLTSVEFTIKVDNVMSLYWDGTLRATSAWDEVVGHYPTNCSQTNGGPHTVSSAPDVAAGSHLLAYKAVNLPTAQPTNPNYATVRVVSNP